MELNYTAQVLIDLAITLLAALCLSRITKRLRLPKAGIAPHSGARRVPEWRAAPLKRQPGRVL